MIKRRPQLDMWVSLRRSYKSHMPCYLFPDPPLHKIIWWKIGDVFQFIITPLDVLGDWLTEIDLSIYTWWQVKTGRVDDWSKIFPMRK